MCGIFGYIGDRQAMPVLLDGLERLEYRGYDSAGIVLMASQGLFSDKCAGKIAALRKRLAGKGRQASIGIGHTRWATHGQPTTENAHPHFSCDRSVALVHNGIFENYRELRDELRGKGHKFRSQTDSEVLAHLIEENLNGDPVKAIGRSLARVRGSFAIAALFKEHPDRIIGARRDSPLIVGLNGREQFVASDIPAVLPYTDKFCLIDNGEILDLRAGGVEVFGMDLKPRRRKVTKVRATFDEAQKHGFPHFMLKEIHEQPLVVQRELQGRERGFDELKISEAKLRGVRRIYLSACGTAWHAALYAKYLFEELAGIPTDVRLSSEFRYSPPPMDKRTLVIAVSQSGETADTLQAVRIARKHGALTVGMTNTPSSTLAREAKGVLYNRAAIEVGVAATKTYIAQMTSLHLLALQLARLHQGMADTAVSRRYREMTRLPDLMKKVLDFDMSEVADRFRTGYDFMYIGRRHNVATAYEGALKMKEISYVHAEGYAAGEMKHGPLALVDSGMATVAIAPRGATYEKVVSNVEEIRARNGRILSVVSKGDGQLARISDVVFEIPQVHEALSPLLAVLPLQQLAYHIAASLGRDVDKPRNLAKSVTVE